MPRVIIAGSRVFTDIRYVRKAMSLLRDRRPDLVIEEVVGGRAPGVDLLGEQWAAEEGVPFKPFPADWRNLEVPGAKIRKNQNGEPYNANAGFDRNAQMARYAAEVPGSGLVALWDSYSPGTWDMMTTAKQYELWVEKFIKRNP